MGDFCMPSLGADMDRGTLLEWRVAPGDAVRRGDIVAVVDTDKSEVEVEVFEAGTVVELLVAEGAEVPVGTAMARIEPSAATEPASVPAAPTEAPSDAPPSSTAPPPTSAPAPVPHTVSPLVRHLAEQEHVDLATIEVRGDDGIVHRTDIERAVAERDATAAEPPPPPAPPLPDPAPAPTPGDRKAASPYARRLAAAQGLDLVGITGSGPDGAVVAQDLVDPSPPAGVQQGTTPAAAPSNPAAPSGDKRASTRRAIARVMARSKREIPHFYLSSTIDVADAVRWLNDVNAERPPDRRLLPAALLLRATALAAARTPGINGHWADEAFTPAAAVDLGIAISLRGGGVVTPAISSAETLSLDDLMADLRDLVERSRAGSVRSSEMHGSITVTNLGDQGVDAVYGVINPPQVAIVGFGRIAERPVAHDGMLAVHPVVECTLSADHRAVDGHLGSRFLRTIDDLLQHPDALATTTDPGAPL